MCERLKHETFERVMQLMKSINEKSVTNLTHIRILWALRDILLPKLIIVEVRVVTGNDE